MSITSLKTGIHRVVALAATLLLAAGVCPAQSTFGTFVGTVHDPSGSVVADCSITLTNAGTSAQRSALTDKEGNYVLVNLEPGSYQIVMQAPGFQSSTFKNLTLLSRQTVRVDASLSVAAQAESVSVSEATEAVITTEVSSIAETKSGRELLELPVGIGSRASGSTSAISTLTTQAGVQTDNAGNLSVAGSKPSMLSVSIDGISTMSTRSNSAIAELFPSFGTIAEIRVSEINNAAEFGGVSDITTVSKGGSNQLHGGIFENLQNTAMNARNPFSATVTKTIMNNYGGYLGGPVAIPHLYNGKDKTFFFMSYEGLQLPRESFISQSVPSAALRSGDLSAYAKAVLDPLGGTFPGNQIPLSRVSSVSQNALKYLFPLANTGAPSAIANNYTTNFATPIKSNQADLRFDQNISSRQTAFIRGTFKLRDVSNAPSATGTILAGATLQPETDFAFTAAHNFIITPTLVNELRAGLTGSKIVTSTGLSAKDIISKIGIPVPDPPSGNTSPVFSITGFQATGSTASSLNKAGTFQLLDNLTWSHGPHTIKVGGDMRRLDGYFSNVFANSRAGQYTFNGSVTNSIINNPFAAFLLGVPDVVRIATVTQPDSFSHSFHWAGYAQDDYKATGRLTVNFGVRWEYHPPFLDSLNNMAGFLPDISTVVNGVPVHGAVVIPDKAAALVNATFAAAIAPTPIYLASKLGISQTLHSSPRTNFAPRIGFAWRPFANGKTVVRGGYGKYIEAMLGTLTNAGWAVEGSNVGSYTNTLVAGKPTLAFPNPVPANLAQPGTPTFELAADQRYTDPYVQQWNLTVERDLGFNTGIRVSYDGNHGSNLGYTKNLTQVPANTVGFATAKVANPYPLWAHISMETTGARSNYDAFTVSGNKRMSHGVQFNTSYTYARNLSNGQGYNPTAFASQAGGMVSDQYNIGLDYGNVAFTRRERLLGTFLYELPFGRKGLLFNKANGIVDQVIGGWQLSGVFVAQTGPFLTVVAPGADPAGNNFPNLEASGRADSVSGVSPIPANQSIVNWVNKDAYTIPKNNIGRAGSSSVGSAVGPGTQALSLSLFKSVQIKEGVRLQIGAAASNALNHPNYAVPNLNYGTAPFGSITNVQTQESGGPRSMQVTARLSF